MALNDDIFNFKRSEEVTLIGENLDTVSTETPPSPVAEQHCIDQDKKIGNGGNEDENVLFDMDLNAALTEEDDTESPAAKNSGRTQIDVEEIPPNTTARVHEKDEKTEDDEKQNRYKNENVAHCSEMGYNGFVVLEETKEKEIKSRDSWRFNEAQPHHHHQDNNISTAGKEKKRVLLGIDLNVSLIEDEDSEYPITKNSGLGINVALIEDEDSEFPFTKNSGLGIDQNVSLIEDEDSEFPITKNSGLGIDQNVSLIEDEDSEFPITKNSGSNQVNQPNVANKETDVKPHNRRWEALLEVARLALIEYEENQGKQGRKDHRHNQSKPRIRKGGAGKIGADTRPRDA